MSTPNPGLIMHALNAYQQTYSLKAAIELEVFTHIAAGAGTAKEIATRTHCAERGIRILCDYLTVEGFLTKDASRYGLSPTATAFLDKKSPGYLGSVSNFLTSDYMMDSYRNMTSLVRHGGAWDERTVSPENPIWVEFARSMAPFTGIGAQIVAQKVGPASKVLDIAAGHGMFGLNVAKLNPDAHIYAQDWTPVLEVAKENAAKMGLADRFHTIPGNAFDADLGTGYDLILVPNFLHHFDHSTNVKLLRRLRSALAPQGRLAIVEFVPNEDRVSPPMPATFSLQMLGGTQAGDAYTAKELDKMLVDADFGPGSSISLAPMPQTLILSTME